jgi:hypothetical protein
MLYCTVLYLSMQSSHGLLDVLVNEPFHKALIH